MRPGRPHDFSATPINHEGEVPVTTHSTQLSAATALVQLLTEHPELSEALSWTISRSEPALIGYVHDGGMPVLAECARILGGSVRASDKTYQRGSQVVRQHVLSSLWRDVPVQVLLSLPVAQTAQVAA
jgi:hypothetical protein